MDHGNKKWKFLIMAGIGLTEHAVEKHLSKSTSTVNPSGKASTQIPQLPLGDNSFPWGDNAICT
jgi:hypothetical protein